jgi:hypothetical protein
VAPIAALNLPPNPVLTEEQVRAGKLVGQLFNFVAISDFGGTVPDGAVNPGFPTGAEVLGDGAIADGGELIDVSLDGAGYHGTHVLVLAVTDGPTPVSARQPYRIVDQVVVDIGPTQFVSRQVSEGCVQDGGDGDYIAAIVDPGPDYPATLGTATTVRAWIADPRSRTFREIDASHVTCPLLEA